MMKKTGFTLAEVLITLAIIGVVATLTLPALMTNTAEQQAKTALKKGINTLTEAAQMNQAIAGWDYASITSANSENSVDTDQSMYNLLSNRTSVDYQKSGKSSEAKQLSYQGNSTDGMKDGNYTVFFRDGASITFPEGITSDQNGGTVLENDNLVYGIAVLYDTNGTKGPNIVSNCEGAALGVTTEKGKETGDNKCTNKAKRIIKDQFGVRLRGGYAVPNGQAARWAFEN